MTRDRNVELVNRWFHEVFLNGDIKALEEIAAEDLILHSQGADEEMVGRDNFNNWLSWYREAFQNSEWVINDIISEEDKVIARYTGQSTYKGGLLNIPSTNQRIVETGILILRVEDSKIKELWSEMSDLQVVQQLGAFPKNK